MNIQINENYRITSDKNNIILEEKKISKEGKNAGQEYYSSIGFFPSIELALKSFTKHNIRVRDTEGIEELKELIKELHEDIKNIKRRV